MKRVLLVTVSILSMIPADARAERPQNLAGPDILRAPLASAPQLENSGGWKARPLMVSGTDAYAGGEYLYQDFIYDSFGANSTDAPLLPPDPVPNSADVLFGGQTGDVVYPTDTKTFGNDAADLLEFRARPTDDGTAYRITLNTMLKSDVAGVAILTSTGPCMPPPMPGVDVGYGIGPVGIGCISHRLVTWGSGAEFDGAPIASSVDTETNQIEVTAPVDYGAQSVTHWVLVGLFDGATKRFRTILDNPTATDPGGAHGADVPPIFNVGFRFNEPTAGLELYAPDEGDLAPGSRTTGIGNWRDHAQAVGLAGRNIGRFSSDIDFRKLRAEVYESHVPTHGYLNRLYVSHIDLGEGAQPDRPMLLGKIQPYALYVPKGYHGRPAPFTLLLHSLSCSYNQYMVFAPHLYDQLGDERGSFLLSPEGRGPDGWWHDAAELDAFEAWADAARHYDFDSSRTYVSGYSMGGYGTFKMASAYPDLFARGFAVVGPADESITGGPSGGLSEDKQNTLNIADNLRNVPLLMWEGTNDELVPLAGTLQYEKRLADLGYRHTQVLWIGYDHFLESIVDRWDEGRDFLGQYPIDPNPEEVVYRYMPEMDNAPYGLVHNHAYWIGGVAAREGARSALVRARTGNTTAGPPVPFTTFAAGAIAAPLRGAFVAKGTDWEPRTQERTNSLELDLTGVASVTIWVDRAGFDLDRGRLTIRSDGPATVRLVGEDLDRTVDVPSQ